MKLLAILLLAAVGCSNIVSPPVTSSPEMKDLQAAVDRLERQSTIMRKTVQLQKDESEFLIDCVRADAVEQKVNKCEERRKELISRADQIAKENEANR